jgi:PHP family Zn ribbon phosphoesterase
MSPARIIEQARTRGIQIVGICDHNSAENTQAAVEAASRRGLHVLPGMEVTTAEEVHLLALFDRLEAVQELQRLVYRHLPGESDEDAFGIQVVASADDDVLGFNNRLLIGATTLRLEQVVSSTRALGGLAIAAHIDRESFSLIGQLGFVPDGLPLDALEVSPALSLEEAARRYDLCMPLVQSSDAHSIEEIGRCRTRLLMKQPSVEEIRKALQGREGRRCIRYGAGIQDR